MKKEVIAKYIDNFSETLVKRKASVTSKNLIGDYCLIFCVSIGAILADKRSTFKIILESFLPNTCMVSTDRFLTEK